MTILIVYEDEVWHNPITYAGIVGNTTTDCVDENNIEEEVKKQSKKSELKTPTLTT